MIFGAQSNRILWQDIRQTLHIETIENSVLQTMLFSTGGELSHVELILVFYAQTYRQIFMKI